MKITQLRFSAIAIALAALTQTVAAQDVKVYGLVDLGIVKLSGGDAKTLTEAQLSNYHTSRLGLKGNENLGGGLKVQVQLESEIMADTGTTDTAFWGRQAWVGLADEAWGAARLGRTKSLYDGLSDYIDPFGNDGIVGAYTKKAWRVGVAESRISNAMQYESPKWHGLRLGAQVSLSELDGVHTGTGLSAVYEIGGFTAIAALDRPVVTKAGVEQPSAWLVGGRYNTGPFTFSLSHNEGDTKEAKKGENTGDTAGFEWAIGSGVVKASYARLSNEANSVKSEKVEVLGLGYEYSLSKRTTLYTAVVKEDVLDVSGITAGISHRF